MEQSFSEGDISLSPSQLLERLQLLRQLQILQKGKLQKQRLDYQDSTGASSSLTEIVSRFSNSTTYNTFSSLLRSSTDLSHNNTPRTGNVSMKITSTDLIDGLSILSVSEDEVISSPQLSRRTRSNNSIHIVTEEKVSDGENGKVDKGKKQIELDEMPILTPKKNFETLLLEKLQTEKPNQKEEAKINKSQPTKKPFLRRGEGTSRFGLKKNDLVIQATNALPWKKKAPSTINKSSEKAKSSVDIYPKESNDKQSPVKIVVNDKSSSLERTKSTENKSSQAAVEKPPEKKTSLIHKKPEAPITNKVVDFKDVLQSKPTKQPLLANKGKTWASLLTKEQDDFLKKLKQSDYYKNFTSPAKSDISDASSYSYTLCQEKETLEQNMFNLIENKVSQDNFNLENSFFSRFLKSNQLECSGESTPIVMQRCLANNPELLQIFPKPGSGSNHGTCADTSCSNYTDCDHETCSTSSSCCSCKTVEETPCKYESNTEGQIIAKDNKRKVAQKKDAPKEADNVKHNNQADIENDKIKANMVEMNAKLVETSNILKERLKELEDEIETFRKENSNIMKVKEEIDSERQKFYEEKATFEQKFNEEKILSEYYLAEEKERLAKQKQIYDKYVREMRGRLNKKDKDEVVALKNEISNLKEEIRMKDAKSTCTIARLRNHLKIMEKEKKDLQDEVEKLKKESKRLHHSNEITRRLTNMKYLEQINRKLNDMSTKDTQSEIIIDPNQKYKAFEIERQSRSKTIQPNSRTVRTRAKSVPNINVTSRYAKYFSQRDAISHADENIHVEYNGRHSYDSDNEEYDDQQNNISLKSNSLESVRDDEINNEENNLEKMYMERFKSATDINHNGYFLTKSDSSKTVKSSSNKQLSRSPTVISSRSKSPISILSNKSTVHENMNHLPAQPNSAHSSTSRSTSPTSNPDKYILKSTFNENYAGSSNIDVAGSKISLTKTKLSPTEIRKADGGRELRFPNGNVKHLSADGKYSKFVYYNGDVKETFLNTGTIKYFYAETKTYHTTHPDGLEVLEFSDGQVEKRYKDGSTEIRLPNGSVRYHDPKNPHVREEWRFPDGSRMTVSANGEQRVVFANGQVEVHAKDHKRREFPDGTVKLQYTDGTTETRFASGRVRIKDKDGRLLMDSSNSR